MKGFYGRFASLVRSQQQNLAFLIECRNYIRSLPDIDTECFTAIVAGMPNVGKSSLVSALTRRGQGWRHTLSRRRRCT